jgi:hypothetical protein
MEIVMISPSMSLSTTSNRRHCSTSTLCQLRKPSVIYTRKKPSPAKESGSRLLLTEEERMACMKNRVSSGHNTGAYNGSDSKSSGKNRGGKQNFSGGRKSTAVRDDVCDYCRVHWPVLAMQNLFCSCVPLSPTIVSPAKFQ